MTNLIVMGIMVLTNWTTEMPSWNGTNYVQKKDVCCVLTLTDLGIAPSNYLFSVQHTDRECTGWATIHNSGAVYVRGKK